MNDLMREFLSYGGLFSKIRNVEKLIEAEKIYYGRDKNQYILFYESEETLSDKVIVWVHGGGWNSGSPSFFDFVGQCMAGQGYRTFILGYRLAPKHKYPSQIEDVCAGYKKTNEILEDRGIDSSKIVVSGPSAGAHLTSILCYDEEIQEKYELDVSKIVGFIGVGGPYIFDESQSLAIKILLNQLFSKGYDRSLAEPFS